MSDIHDRIERTFQTCDTCGGYFVNVASHQCSTGGADGTGPTREERVQRAAEDTRPDDEHVALLPTRGNDGSYAYHELDAEGVPACGGGGVLDDEQWIRLPRREAKARAKSPCGTCRWLTGESVDSGSRGPDTARRTGR